MLDYSTIRLISYHVRGSVCAKLRNLVRLALRWFKYKAWDNEDDNSEDTDAAEKQS